jgi:RND superfamily putative drug exporter
MIATITPIPTGRLARLGAWSADHRRTIAIVWAAVLLCLGVLAPFADKALSGAGWEAPRSESTAARGALQSAFPGRGAYALKVVVAGGAVGDPSVRQTLQRVRSMLRRDRAVSGVLMPRAGTTIAVRRSAEIDAPALGGVTDAIAESLRSTCSTRWIVATNAGSVARSAGEWSTTRSADELVPANRFSTIERTATD